MELVNSQPFSISIRPAEWRDVGDLAYIKTESFRQDPYGRLLAGTIDEDSTVVDAAADKIKLKRLLNYMKAMLCRSDHLIEVAVLNGRVVGYAIWTVHLGTDEPQGLHHRLRKLGLRERIHTQKAAPTRYLISCLPECVQQWLRGNDEKKLDRVLEERYDRILSIGGNIFRKHVPGNSGKTGYWFLSNLGTLPGLQGKGIGSALVRRGCQMATEDRVPIYLKASAAGKTVYEKAGFKVLEEWELRDGDISYGSEAVMRFDPERR